MIQFFFFIKHWYKCMMREYESDGKLKKKKKTICFAQRLVGRIKCFVAIPAIRARPTCAQ